ncbi:unnamed protein product [Arctogadus glacialis]
MCTHAEQLYGTNARDWDDRATGGLEQRIQLPSSTGCSPETYSLSGEAGGRMSRGRVCCPPSYSNAEGTATSEAMVLLLGDCKTLL